MKWKKISLMILSMGVLWIVGCGEESPLSPGAEGEMSAPAAKLTMSNRVAGTCELPHCRPGFGASAVSDPTGSPWQAADVVGGAALGRVGRTDANRAGCAKRRVLTLRAPPRRRSGLSRRDECEPGPPRTGHRPVTQRILVHQSRGVVHP